MATCLRYDFQPPLDGAVPYHVAAELFERGAAETSFDLVDAIQNIEEPKAWRPLLDHLKHLHRVAHDIISNERMQTPARRQVDRPTENLGEAICERKERKSKLRRGIEIAKQINIAVSTGLAAGNRTE